MNACSRCWRSRASRLIQDFDGLRPRFAFEQKAKSATKNGSKESAGEKDGQQKNSDEEDHCEKTGGQDDIEQKIRREEGGQTTGR
jgi:hypothetical protein